MIKNKHDMSNNEAQFQQLLFLLKGSKDNTNYPRIIFVSINEAKYRDKLIHRLTENLHEQNVIFYDFASDISPKMDDFLKKKLPTDVLSSSQGEYIINTYGMAKHVNKNFFSTLNSEQESLRNSYPFIQLWWESDDFFDEVEQSCPDFFRSITHAFEFDSKQPDEPPFTSRDRSPFRYQDPTKGLSEEKKKYIKFLTDWLSELNVNRSTYQKELANIYFAFIDEYTKANLYDEVKDYIEKAKRAAEAWRNINPKEHSAFSNLIIVFCLDYLAKVHFDLREFDDAIICLDDAMTLDESQLGHFLHEQGLVYAEQRIWDLALENFDASLEWKEKHGFEDQMAKTYSQIAIAYSKQHMWDLATDYFDKALTYEIKCNNIIEKCATYRQIGIMYFERRMWGIALDYFDMAIECQKKVGKEDDMGKLYNNIGTVYHSQRMWNQAHENYDKALKWYEKNGSLYDMGNMYNNIALAYSEQRLWDLAHENYNKSLECKEKIKNDLGVGIAYHQIGMLYATRFKWNLSFENHNKALLWKMKSGNDYEIGTTYHQIGAQYGMLNKWDLALENCLKALEHIKKSGNRHSIDGTYINIGNIYMKQRKSDLAIEYYTKGIEWLDINGKEREKGNVYQSIAGIYFEQQEWEHAAKWYKKAEENMIKFNDIKVGLVFYFIATCYYHLKLYPEGMKKAEEAIYFLEQIRAEDRLIHASKGIWQIIDEEFSAVDKENYDAYREANPIDPTQ